MSNSRPSRLETREVRTLLFDNGLALLAEEAAEVESAAFTLAIPSGCAYDPPHRLGLANLTCELALRGAGPRDNRMIVAELENLGVERGESVGASQSTFSGATLGENLLPALAIYADIVQRPLLPKAELESARLTCLQEIAGADDEPSQKLMDRLRRRAYPEPWGRPSHGAEQGVSEARLDDVRQFWQESYTPCGAILAVAGRFDWDALADEVRRLFADWQGASRPVPQPRSDSLAESHVPFDSNQAHIGIAYPSIPYRHPDYLQAWAATGVLSGGASSRLFTEVREKRGLCYTVSASLQSQVERACVFCYAGTTMERAQETLDVTYSEVLRLADGIQPDELQRLKARIKSGLIMQQESTVSRSGSIARDWRHLGRVRSLDELSANIDALTADSINSYLAAHPPREFTFATLGPNQLTLPH